ncbi:MAG: SAM-dependent methyltransferase [Proteobacteria bacterium]|nr:SAM-dependent methyltransferase [Pseudomonadota bacterium]
MIKYFFLASLLMPTPLFASAQGESGWEHVRATAASGKPLQVLLGAMPHEAHMQGIHTSGLRIYVDLDTAGVGRSTTDAPFLRADFNTLAFWQRLGKVLPQKVDTVVCDVSVTRFIAWDVPTLLEILRCSLTSTGSIYLPEMRLASQAPKEVLWIHHQPDVVAEILLKGVDRKTLPWHFGPDKFKEAFKPHDIPAYVAKGNGGMQTTVTDGVWSSTPNYVVDAVFGAGGCLSRLVSGISYHMGSAGYPDIGLASRVEYGEMSSGFSFVKITKK